MSDTQSNDTDEKITIDNCLTEIAFLETTQPGKIEDRFKNIMSRLTKQMKELVVQKQIKSLSQLETEVKKLQEQSIDLNLIILTEIQKRTQFENVDKFMESKIEKLKELQIPVMNRSI